MVLSKSHCLRDRHKYQGERKVETDKGSNATNVGKINYGKRKIRDLNFQNTMTAFFIIVKFLSLLLCKIYEIKYDKIFSKHFQDDKINRVPNFLMFSIQSLFFI